MIPFKTYVPLAQLENLMSGQVLYACLIILILAVAGFIAVQYVRRWSRSSDAPSGGGFTLADLRKLRQDGKISDEELKATSALIAKSAAKDILSAAPAKPAARKSDK